MLQVLFGDPNEKKVTRYTGLVNQINALGTDIKGLSDKDLQVFARINDPLKSVFRS